MASDRLEYELVIPGFRRVSPLQRMFPHASREPPAPPLPRARGQILADHERGAVSPLGGVAQPAPPRKGMR
jgi:hypothetical protein